MTPAWLRLRPCMLPTRYTITLSHTHTHSHTLTLQCVTYQRWRRLPACWPSEGALSPWRRRGGAGHGPGGDSGHGGARAMSPHDESVTSLNMCHGVAAGLFTVSLSLWTHTPDAAPSLSPSSRQVSHHPQPDLLVSCHLYICRHRAVSVTRRLREWDVGCWCLLFRARVATGSP